MGRALLGNGPVNTPRPNTHKATMEDCLREECYCALLVNSAPIKTMAKNHVTCFLRGLPYTTIELGFLCVWSVPSLCMKQWRLFERITCVRAGPNTSTMTLQVVGYDEKGSLKSESKIWSRIPKDMDPRKTALASASSIYKRQTRPIVRKGAPEKQDRNCQRVINIWSWARDGPRHQDWLADRPTDRQSECDLDFDLTSRGFVRKTSFKAVQ
jgi:hypothetical protein